MDFVASAGLLTVLEPPLFEALLHNTATQAGEDGHGRMGLPCAELISR